MMNPSYSLRRSRRGASPVNPNARALLEPVWWPIYDANTVSATQSADIDYFRDPVGTNSKSFLDTNMDRSRALASPKLAYVYGIGVHFIDTTPDSDGNSDDGVSSGKNSALEFLNAIGYATAVRFFIGEKDYIRAPTIYAPANYRVQGLCNGGPKFNGTAGILANGVDVSMAYLVGKPFLTTRKIMRINPDQTFGASLMFPKAISVAPAATGTAKAYIILWSELHRETQ